MRVGSVRQERDKVEGSSGREGLVHVGSLRQGDGDTQQRSSGRGSGSKPDPGSTGSTKSGSASKQASVSDSLGAAMPGSFLTATDLQELARVYVVCLK